MSLDQEIISSFKKLGLTEYEAKTYLTLVKKAEASPLEITLASKVPQPKVYTSLNSLAAKGLVEVVSERPRKCKAVNIREAVRRLFEKKITELGENAKKIIEKTIKEELEGKIQPHEIYNLIGEAETKKKLIDMLSLAEKEVLLATKNLEILRFKKIKDVLSKLAMKGVEFKVLVEFDSLDTETLLFLKNFGTRVVDVLEEQSLVTVDGKIAITTSVIETGIGPSVWFSTFTTCTECVKAYVQKLNSAWLKGSKLPQETRNKGVKIAAIVLAAGKPSSENKNVLLYPWRNKPVICHVIEALMFSDVDEIVVVTGYQSKKIQKVINERFSNVSFVHNKNYGEGMLSSFKKGLEKVKESDAVLLMLGDQPFIEPSIINEMIKEFKRNKEKKKVINPVFKGKRGHPVLISSHLYKEILGTNNKKTVREVLNQYKESTVLIEGKDWVLMDVNTIKDLEKAEKII